MSKPLYLQLNKNSCSILHKWSSTMKKMPSYETITAKWIFDNHDYIYNEIISKPSIKTHETYITCLANILKNYSEEGKIIASKYSKIVTNLHKSFKKPP